MKVNLELLFVLLRRAFFTGDVEALRMLKALCHENFPKLSDLGEGFEKYGLDGVSWDDFIADSLQNAKHANRVPLNQMSESEWQEKFLGAFNRGDIQCLRVLELFTQYPWPKSLSEKYGNQFTPKFLEDVNENRRAWIEFCEKFNKAFYTGDVEILIILKSLGVQGFDSLSDIGPQYERYESELLGWPNLISNALQNRPSDS